MSKKKKVQSPRFGENEEGKPRPKLEDIFKNPKALNLENSPKNETSRRRKILSEK